MTEPTTMIDFPVTEWAWGPEQVRTYALAIGAPWSAMDDNDLALVTGRAPTAFPTFAVLLADAHSLRYHALPGVEYDPLDVIYAGHELELPGPVPSEASGTTMTRLTTVGDIRPGVVAVRESESRDAAGNLIARNRVTSIIRGKSVGAPVEGLRGSSSVIPEFDSEIDVPTLPQQALLYALTGDDNPLHLLPGAARSAGFDRPILHGLCSYAMVAHALIRERVGGRWGALRRISARFSSPLVPGETIRVRSARRDNSLIFEAWAGSGDFGSARKVITHGELTVSDWL